MTRRYWLLPLVVLLVFASYQFRSQARQDPQNPTQIEPPSPAQPEQQESKENFFQGEERAIAGQKVESLNGIQARRQKKILALPGVMSHGIGLDENTREIIFVITLDQDKPMPRIPATI